MPSGAVRTEVVGRPRARRINMNPEPSHSPIEGGLIQRVVLVDRLTRPVTGVFHAPTLPGHLLHYVVEGEVEQQVSGQIQRLKPGSLVWYHENEAVEGRILRAPWVFFTVNFLASRLPPPPFERRVWQPDPVVAAHFQALLDAWCDDAAPPIVRHIQVLARLLNLLVDAMPSADVRHRVGIETQLWWDIEAKLREDLGRPIDLPLLQSLVRRGRQSIVRACRLAVGMSPAKRIKEIRLSYARGLVLYSRMPMTEIAMRVGYSRVQELSRDYRLKYGRAPTEDRDAGPDYRDGQIDVGH